MQQAPPGRRRHKRPGTQHAEQGRLPAAGARGVGSGSTHLLDHGECGQVAMQVERRHLVLFVITHSQHPQACAPGNSKRGSTRQERWLAKREGKGAGRSQADWAAPAPGVPSATLARCQRTPPPGASQPGRGPPPAAQHPPVSCCMEAKPAGSWTPRRSRRVMPPWASWERSAATPSPAGASSARQRSAGRLPAWMQPRAAWRSSEGASFRARRSRRA